MRGDVAVKVLALPALGDVDPGKQRAQLLKLQHGILADVACQNEFGIDARKVLYKHFIAHSRNGAAHFFVIFIAYFILLVKLKDTVFNSRVASDIEP